MYLVYVKNLQTRFDLLIHNCKISFAKLYSIVIKYNIRFMDTSNINDLTKKNITKHGYL